VANALLMSNSTNPGGSYLAHAQDALLEILDGRDELTFIPYALADHDGYTAQVREALAPLGIRVVGLHTAADPAAAAGQAQAIFTGGGNTFRLLKTLYELDLLEPIRERARGGMPYLGASAGTNIAGPTVRTTNDMPIVEPPSLTALGLVPFQLNPHYLDPDPTSRHMGETREKRIAEFHEVNDVPVLGLREGTWLRVDGATATVGGGATTAGRGPARLFRPGTALEVAGDVSDLLTPTREPHWG
jgi:dipeptidase E